MDDPKPSNAPRPITPLKTGLISQPNHSTAPDEKIFCDRCGGEVYRMHAVWRCSKCGFKSDCCGW